MKETGRLDVLAIVGGALTLMVIAGMAYNYISLMGMPGDNPLVQSRERILRRMPDSDLRADFDALSAPLARGEYAREEVRELDQAAEKFPNSARLHFHEGLLGSKGRRVRALEQAVRLDPGNALPYYMLAYHATSDGSLDKAAALLAKGNRQSRMTNYPFPEVVPGDITSIATSSVNSTIGFSWYGKVRRIAMALSKRAADLHASGNTNEAVSLLGEIRKMGMRIIKRDKAEIMDVLIGSALLHICRNSESRIYTPSPERLDAAAKEKAWLDYLSAGGYYHSAKSMEDLVRTLARFTTPSTAVSSAGSIQALLLLVCTVWWGLLAMESRRKAAEGPHGEATEMAFPRGRLVKIYAVLFLIVGTVTGGSVLFANSPVNPVWSYGGGEVAGWLMAAIVLVMLIKAIKCYKRAYVSEESPRFWRRAPAQEKREIMRRLVGFQGGMVIALAVFGLLVCGYTKTTMHAFPWQYDRVISDLRQREVQYTADLVAGKIKVPQKYIDEVKREEAKRTGGSK